MYSKSMVINGYSVYYYISDDRYEIAINGETVKTGDVSDNINPEELERIIYNIIVDREKLNTPPTQEEIQAEILLNQVDILANQNAQDEVLAEVLLNSLEVSTNV